jgi:DNA-binding CsgD family transcriptional regulator
VKERLANLERPARPAHLSTDPAHQQLTPRELRVLKLLSGHLSERDIAGELFLSHNTVHSHVQSIYRKLGVSSRTEAVEHARENRSSLAPIPVPSPEGRSDGLAGSPMWHQILGFGGRSTASWPGLAQPLWSGHVEVLAGLGFPASRFFT